MNDPEVQARLDKMRPAPAPAKPAAGRKLSKLELALIKVRAHSEFLHGQQTRKGTRS